MATIKKTARTPKTASNGEPVLDVSTELVELLLSLENASENADKLGLDSVAIRAMFLQRSAIRDSVSSSFVLDLARRAIMAEIRDNRYISIPLKRRFYMPFFAGEDTETLASEL